MVVERRIENLGGETHRFTVQLQMLQRRRLRETGNLGVNLISERGTTPTMVKAPKCQLSDKGLKVFVIVDSEEVGLEAAIL